MVNAHKLERSLTWRVAVPLALTFAILGSVAFDYLAQDLTKGPGDTNTVIRNVKSWHFLLSTAPFSVVFMFVWYSQLRHYLIDLSHWDPAGPPAAWLAWLGIILQLFNALVSLLFVIGGATTWFSGSTIPSSATDPVRIYTIIVGAFGIIAFGLSGGLGVWVQMNVRGIGPHPRQQLHPQQQLHGQYEQARMLPSSNNLGDFSSQATWGAEPYAQQPSY